MRRAILSISLLAVMFLAVTGNAFASPSECDSIPGIDAILLPGSAILLGEIHGTNESPEMVARIACLALNRDLEVTIALELLIEDQETVDQYLAGNGTAEDRQKLIAGEFWQRDYQDGRASEAMVNLIENVRVLGESYGDAIRILLLDDPSSELGRDRFMAERIKSEMEANPKRFIVSLTGNVHNQVTSGNDFKPMGCNLVELIPEHTVISLNLEHAGGTAWVCAAGYECGPMKLVGYDDGSGCYLFNDKFANPRTGLLSIGEITASLPAKDTFR